MKYMATVMSILTVFAAQSLDGAENLTKSDLSDAIYDISNSSNADASARNPLARTVAADDDSEIRAIEADVDLNNVYSELRENLPPSEQATLRAEQREWLKQRDRLRKNSPEYASFIESRVEVLKDRLEESRDRGE